MVSGSYFHPRFPFSRVTRSLTARSACTCGSTAVRNQSNSLCSTVHRDATREDECRPAHCAMRSWFRFSKRSWKRSVGFPVDGFLSNVRFWAGFHGGRLRWQRVLKRETRLMNNSCSSQRVTGNRVNLGFLVNAVAGFARVLSTHGRRGRGF